MPRQTRRVALGPLMGANSTRITDRALQGTYMRGGYNVQIRDGSEWWVRHGQTDALVRVGSVVWSWVIPFTNQITILANPWYAVAYNKANAAIEPIYTPAISENISVTSGSASATMAATTPTVGQMIIIGSFADDDDVYRVKARTGTAVTLDRVYGGTSGTKAAQLIDPLARNTSGTAQSYSFTNGARPLGSAVLFEQLVTHSSTALHAASPAVTGGNVHLVITSGYGVPVAIDLSAYLAGSAAAVKRTFFYNTALSTAAQIGSDTAVDGMTPRGIWATTYKGRLVIAAASDPNGKFGSRTIWYSAIGDMLSWHTGIKGQTAAPNFITFDGDGNAIGGMEKQQDAVLVLRDSSQMVMTATGGAPPFVVRENNQGIGTQAGIRTNRTAVANGLVYFWSPQGLMVFDGSSVRPVAPTARDALIALRFLYDDTMVRGILHDTSRRLLYVLGSYGERVPGALPATANVELLDGSTVQNYSTVFVYDYINDTYWFEDHPTFYGGGMGWDILDGPTPNAQLFYISRADGTLLSLHGGGVADSSHLTPLTNADNVPVNAVARTGWMDLGSLSQKQLLAVETIERSLLGGNILDWGQGLDLSTGNYWMEVQVYSDLDESTESRADGTIYASADTQISTEGDFGQSSTFAREFTPRAHGRRFKFAFSNVLSAAAVTAGYIQAPFRISDIEVEFTERQSTTSQSTLGSASLAE